MPQPHLPDRQHDPLPDEGSSVFAIGNPHYSHEMSEDGLRTFRWTLGEDDESLAEIAGWESYRAEEAEVGFGRLLVPIGSRSASTVLAGLEAWAGEKLNVVRYVAKYQNTIKKLGGVVDIGVAFDSVAVTKDHNCFITPPHILSGSQTDADMWTQDAILDLQAILADEPNVGFLVQEFLLAISENSEAEA